MTAIIELKDRIKGFCSRYEIYIVPVLRILVAYLAFNKIENEMSYMSRLNSSTLILVLALVCAIFPTNMIVVLATLMVLLNLYELNLSACVFVLLIFLILYFLYFRFSPKDGFVAVLTPLFLSANMPYILPIAVGLLSDNPASVFAMVAGGISFYLLKGITLNASTLSVMGEDDSFLTKLIDVTDYFIANKEMIYVVVIMAVVGIVVWVIRHIPVEHSWAIAVGFGSLLQFALRFMTITQLKLTESVGMALLGNVIAALVGVVLTFFFFNLNYERTERVQFEDDDYYYYVKAVPKRFVQAKEKTVKKFGPEDLEEDENEEATEEELLEKVAERERRREEYKKRHGM